MPASWTQKFDFYIGRLEGDLTVVRLDMAAIDYAPVSTHTTALIVSVPMKHPTENGLRSDEEFDAMVHAEKVLVPSIEDGVGAIYWGQHIGRGRTDFFFYVQGEPDRGFLTRLQSLVALPGYLPELRFAHDPDWSQYRYNFPGNYHKQTMWNRQLQAQLEQRGDRLSKRRVIDHLAFFPSAEAAKDAAGRLKKAKFSTDRVQGPDESGAYVLEFHRKDSCDGRNPDQITIEVLDSIEPSAGIYDGWGCAVHR